MPIELKMPALSPTMEEGTLARWLVKEGDTVASGDLIAEIETDKATMEFEAVDEGVIVKLLVAEGADGVKVGTVIAIIAEEGEDASAAAASASAPAAAPAPAAASSGGAEPVAAASASSPPVAEKGYGANPETDTPTATKEEVAAAAPAGAAPQAAAGDRIKASPLARRLAESSGVDLASLTGSGPKGRIVKADVEAGPKAKPAAAAAPAAKPAEAKAAPAAPVAAAAPAAAPAGVPSETIKLSNMRKTIARRLAESKQTVPHFYLTVDCNLDALLKLRGELNAGLESRGIKLSVNDLLIKALGVALVEVPDANVQFAGDTLIKFGRADVSMAVAIPGGLITPVITDVANKPLSKIASEAKDVAARARDGKLAPEEYQGGTASISNLGMFGIKQFDAVINPPQAMILAVGAGEPRPYVVGKELAIATVMTATGSFDHRAIDGAVGAQLMAAFKRLVEKPLGMLA
ncbi:pyruvate dehydrogenase complex dihydrolipoamide acetyltransferase [Sphingomonas prati]|uniref:Acetyltransferase component of pyruvate dehydrogenase complex n=1 Tax=Sphingomonas prati TaxID=1843237 RepID=A0A7W9F007_9SPHN|nr:pyruvate dehydrogenase complex dihydrolipoamide acetyltransferase [Sphingomonas prati]MBB5727831.1 pyruvate dehydrogenase E2 component (dihydrolipoamide acetyltransferase) [Sphingomonas prati]GGE81100.1 acetyltransferase component of pyruvate dehydrogenase complex [Sphingomonas prati]